MTTDTVRADLRHLGWKMLDGGQLDGRWWLAAKSCGQIVLVIADTQDEALSAMRSATMKITWGAAIEKINTEACKQD